jgi:L-iditol 2-dehydrogenase
MKALRLHNKQDLRLHDEDIPKAAKGEVLIKVGAVGLCGSDIHWFFDGGIGTNHITRPKVLGHEFSGIVVEGELEGKKVAIDPGRFCGTCQYCLLGQPHLCNTMEFAGEGFDGGLQEYIAWPREAVHVIPDSFTLEDGAMLEILGVCIHALELARPMPGDRVGVVGCGPVGLLLVQLARLMGAGQIVATDRLEHRIDAAIELGATEVFLARETKEIAEVMRCTGNEGVDVCYEVAGDQEGYETSIGISKKGAQVVFAGIPNTNRISFQASAARYKALTMKNLTRTRFPYPRAIRLVESGLVDLRGLISHRFPLEEFDSAFKTAVDRKGLKVIIQPGS